MASTDKNVQPPEGFRGTRWLILRGLGLLYLLAFLDLSAQLPALVGDGGVTPMLSHWASMQYWLAETFMGSPAQFLVLFQSPSFGWVWDGSDEFIVVICQAGMAFSTLLLVGVDLTIVPFLCWLIYLGLHNLSGLWMSFGIDYLLLELGFAALFLTHPFKTSASQTCTKATGPAIFLVRTVLVRALLMAGLTRLDGGNFEQNGLVGFETAPIPTLFAWEARNLPRIFGLFRNVVEFYLQLVFPVLGLFIRRIRPPTIVVLILHGAVMMLTANSGLLYPAMIVAGLSFLEDEDMSLLWKLTGPGRKDSSSSRSPGYLRRILEWLTVILTVFVATEAAAFLVLNPEDTLLSPVSVAIAPFRIVNWHVDGFHRPVRPEIVIEGSVDGYEWMEYELECKPQVKAELSNCFDPAFPRLDTMMSLASTSTYSEHGWFVSFIARLLEGSPKALRFVHGNPFPDEPPTFLRAVVYRYEMTDHQWVRQNVQDKVDAGVPSQYDKIFPDFQVWRTSTFEFNQEGEEKMGVGLYMPEMELSNESFQEFLGDYGWWYPEHPQVTKIAELMQTEKWQDVKKRHNTRCKRSQLFENTPVTPSW